MLTKIEISSEAASELQEAILQGYIDAQCIHLRIVDVLRAIRMPSPKAAQLQAAKVFDRLRDCAPRRSKDKRLDRIDRQLPTSKRPIRQLDARRSTVHQTFILSKIRLFPYNQSKEEHRVK
ncbi:hypothetical protein ASE11_01225 [Hydrogenophaga sp. Root209]|nr:hypothetical protein ASE11_01225 [Hydrogenophaga sp. Root209]